MAIDFSRALDPQLRMPTFQRRNVDAILKGLAQFKGKDDTHGDLSKAVGGNGHKVSLGGIRGKTAYAVASVIYPLTNVERASYVLDMGSDLVHVMLVEFDEEYYVLKLEHRGGASPPWQVTRVKKLLSLPYRALNHYSRPNVASDSGESSNQQSTQSSSDGSYLRSPNNNSHYRRTPAEPEPPYRKSPR